MKHEHFSNSLASLGRDSRARLCGMFSICSAHRYVLKAAMRRALREGTLLLIEATSNQVNQNGGYTGMTPEGFRSFVKEIAHESGLPFSRLILGGDHLGPNPWRSERSEQALANAREMVQAYVKAGFTKIHIDASMPCADDEPPLSDEEAAWRTAELCAAAEALHSDNPTLSAPPFYVIGTEVPSPGGARETIGGIKVTNPDDAERVIAVTRNTFQAQRLHEAWERVIAVVVQPGVEFDVHGVIDYDREKARELSKRIERYENLVYEAHSTDYQTRKALREMVENRFAILKVGPWLTFAFREAVFALSDMERELCPVRRSIEPSNLKEVSEQVMTGNPGYWKAYYHGSADETAFACKYSYSDRIRYYWPNRRIQDAVERLMANFKSAPAPLTLVSQYMPRQYTEIREGRICNDPEEMVLSRIDEVLDLYSSACSGI